MIALLSGATVADAWHPADVEALPLIVRLDAAATPVVVRGQLSSSRAKLAQTEAARVIDDVSRRFLRRDAVTRRLPVDLCLFDTEPQYVAFVARVCANGGGCSPLGFYVPQQRLIVANLGRSVGNLRHELTHALIGDDFPKIPAWFNEGIAALYGTVRRDGRGYRWVVNYRLRDVKAALAEGTLPTLPQLARATDHDVYGPRKMVYYGLARHLLLYLEQQGKLRDFYIGMRDSAITVDAQAALLAETVDEKVFLEWVKRQK